MKLKVILLSLLLCSSALARYEAFKERFEFVREDGKLIAVRDKSLTTNFNISYYLDYIKNEILKEQALIQSSAINYESELSNFLNDEQNLGEKSSKNNQRVVASMLELGNVDFNAVFNNQVFKEFFVSFESKLKEAFFYVDPMLVAKPDNSKFFYKRAVTYKVVNWALNQARKRFSTIPLLNTATYVITEIEKLITKRRMFHQNMLLHYLELIPEGELGLSKFEADTIFSSIYESRIDWFAFWESARAAANWDRYGSHMFYQTFRTGSAKLRNYKSLYTSIDERLNYSFQEVTFNNERVIINLFDKENMLQSRPAIAYSYDRPERIKRLRQVLTLAKLGLSFVSLPAIIKDIANDYIKSYYEKQQITEGALFAHFEAQEEFDQMSVVRKQYINPFDRP